MSAQGKLRKCQDGVLQWYCPGCECYHGVNSGWTFNGNYESPTIRPSVLVNKDLSCPDAPRCHCWITEGKIEFLGDCTHELAGVTVPMEDEE